jgi:O-antigen/teichoic acid export membrane protein
MGLSSLPPSSPSISPQLQRKIRTGILWVIGATLLFALPSNSQSAFGTLFLALGLQNAVNFAIERAIVQSPRQDQPFLNTAWTLQIFCGIACCLLGCGFVGFMVLYFKQPLSYWLPTLGISSFAIVATSLNSTKIASAERDFAWKNVITIHIVTAWIGKVVAFFITISPMRFSLGSQLPSWDLLIKSSVSAVSFCWLSHFFTQGMPNKIQWENAAFQSIYRYGRWIIAIVIIDSLQYTLKIILVGKFLDIESLGSYYFLLNINSFIMGFGFVYALRHWILFPVYSKIIRTYPYLLNSLLKKSRLITIGFMSILIISSIFLGKPLLLMIFGGRWERIIDLLPLLTLPGIVHIISSTYDDVLYAQGKTSTLFSFTAIQVVLEIALIVLGMGFGLQGVLLGSIISSYLMYAVKAIYFSRQSLWQPSVDFPFLAIASILLIVFFSQGKGLSLVSLG